MAKPVLNHDGKTCISNFVTINSATVKMDSIDKNAISTASPYLLSLQPKYFFYRTFKLLGDFQRKNDRRSVIAFFYKGNRLARHAYPFSQLPLCKLKTCS